MRIRARKAGIRAVIRTTAEKHAPLSGIACYVRIEVIGEVSSRTCAYLYRHILAVLANHHNFNVAFLSG